MKCAAHGCVNTSEGGYFAGPFCMPCIDALKTGKAEHGTSWIFTQQARLAEAERQRDDTMALLTKVSLRKSCEGTQPYICHGLATARARLAEAERVCVQWAEWNAYLRSRLAEKDETIDRMQGLLETCDASMETLRARLTEARGCFDAALFEGWLDALANGDIERIRDLWTRRISFAMEAVTADSAPVAFWDCDCGQVNDDPTCIRCGATPTVPVAPEAK